MSVKTRIDQIEAYFGYALAPGLRERIKAEITDDPDTPAKQTDAFFVDAFLDWRGEHWDGPNPAHAFLKALCGGEIPPAQLRPRDPMRMALHFSGLFVLHVEHRSGKGGFIEDGAYWVADANPRQDGIETCPVYRCARGDPLRPYLVESPARLDAWRAALSAIERLDRKVLAKKKPPLLAALLAEFPWPVAAERERLVQRGVLEQEDAVPEVAPPSDPEADRLSRAMEAALPIAEVLSARASGGEGRLAGPVAKRALAFAAKHPDFPPSRVLRLLALALSGDRKGAEAEAERVLGAKDAPALARRWADRIARKLPPFDR